MATRTLSDAEKAILGIDAAEKMGETETVSDQPKEETSQAPNVEMVGTQDGQAPADKEPTLDEKEETDQELKDDPSTQETSIENAAPAVITETKSETSSARGC